MISPPPDTFLGTHPAAAPAAAAHVPPRGDAVLLVAVEEDARALLAPALLEMALHAAQAQDVPAALERMRIAGAAVIVADMSAAHMDVAALLDQARDLDPDAEVIVLAAKGGEARAVAALALGAADYVPRPLNGAVLAHRVDKARERVLLRRSLAEQARDRERLVREKSARLVELAERDRRYRDLFDAVPCAITVQDRELTVVEANKTFLRDFGARVGSSCYAAYKHRQEPCPDCPILATFEDASRHQAETVVTDIAGETRNILIWTAPLFAPDGSVEKVMEVSTDITQIRQLQDHLSSLGMMLGSMSHGVKGLLTGLDGGLYRVESGLRKGDMDKVRSGWAVVRHRVERIRKMVLDILYYAKSRELDMGEMGLGPFAEELAMLVESKAVAGGIVFRRDFAHGEVCFEADHSALSSALVNFLENAVDACLSEMTGREREVVFGARVEGERAVFEVTDNGVGMDRESREKMFTLFFSSKGSKGTGIGLFISNRVFAQHHGGIEVESAPERGTRIRAWLPLRQRHNHTAVAPAPEVLAAEVLAAEALAPGAERAAEIGRGA